MAAPEQVITFDFAEIELRTLASLGANQEWERELSQLMREDDASYLADLHAQRIADL